MRNAWCWDVGPRNSTRSIGALSSEGMDRNRCDMDRYERDTDIERAARMELPAAICDQPDR